MATYLQLPPEFGGTRFGPYQGGIVYIGSDPNRCQIVLDAKLGVFAVHCVVSETGPNAYTVSLAQQGLKLFLVQKGERKAWPIESAVQAKSGDQLVLVSETGPRFVLEYTPDQPQTTPNQGHRPNGSTDLGSGIANEMARRAQAQLIAKTPISEHSINSRPDLSPGFGRAPISSSALLAPLELLFLAVWQHAVGCSSGSSIILCKEKTVNLNRFLFGAACLAMATLTAACGETSTPETKPPEQISSTDKKDDAAAKSLQSRKALDRYQRHPQRWQQIATPRPRAASSTSTWWSAKETALWTAALSKSSIPAF